jgi:ABC-type uncharacterized transport system involved in gliding motility auxiliary subunit
MIIVLGALLIGLNVLVSGVTSARIDTTATAQFSISDASKQVVQKLPQAVTVYVFSSAATNSTAQNAVVLLDQYRQHNSKLTIQQVDLQANQQAATSLGVKNDPDYIFEMGTGSDAKRQEVGSADEQSFTRAMLALQSTVQYRVFFVQGHGEPQTQAAAQVLHDNNYLVDTLNLTTNAAGGSVITGTVTLNPQTDVLAIIAPQQAFSSAEIKRVTDFLAQGGKALVFDNFAGQFPQSASQSKININSILQPFGVKFDTGIVSEEDPTHVQFRTPFAPVPTIADASNDIVRGLNDIPIVMPNTSAIDQIKDSPVISNQTFTALYKTSDKSYLRSDLTNQSSTHEKDTAGPFTLVASLELPISTTVTPATPNQPDTKNPKTRLVLFSSYLWVTDEQQVGLAQQAGSYLLLQNAVNWLVAQPDTVVVPPKNSNLHSFSISTSQDSFVFYSVTFGLPLLVMLIGLAVWWRRR